MYYLEGRKSERFALARELGLSQQRRLAIPGYHASEWGVLLVLYTRPPKLLRSGLLSPGRRYWDAIYTFGPVDRRCLCPARLYTSMYGYQAAVHVFALTSTKLKVPAVDVPKDSPVDYLMEYTASMASSPRETLSIDMQRLGRAGAVSIFHPPPRKQGSAGSSKRSLI